MYGATPILPHMAWCLSNDRKIYSWLYIVQPRMYGSIPSVQENLLHNMKTGCVFRQAHYKFRIGGSFPGVKRPGIQANSYIIQCLCCKLYGATPTLPHMACCSVNDRKIYRCLPIK
jgi:hypothetical protein